MPTKIADSASPLFQDSMIYRPFIYPWADEMFDGHESIHWVASEIELGDDSNDWSMNLTADEKAYVKNILTIFTTGDQVVAKNYRDCFLRVIKNNEASNLLMSIANREGTHQKAYSIANDTFGFDDSIFTMYEDIIEMKDRLENMFVDNSTDTVEGLAKNFAHSVYDEGVALFGVFIGLLQFMRRDIPAHNGMKGRLPGFSKINAWSLRDETVHTDAGVMFFNTLTNEHPQIVTDSFKKDIYEMFRRGVAYEDAFIDRTFESLHLTTFTPEECKLYIRFIADRRLTQLGLKPNFGVTKNPSPWVEKILTENKITSFFERKVSSYQVGNAFTGTLDMSKVLAIPR